MGWDDAEKPLAHRNFDIARHRTLFPPEHRYQLAEHRFVNKYNVQISAGMYP